MKLQSKLLVLLLVLGFASCKQEAENHFITDKAYRNEVVKAFEETKEIAKSRTTQLFGVFDQNITTEEKEALQFLYAFMPLSDLSNYSSDFFLKNVRLAFAARDTFAWGQSIPEDVFRHFVLPYRINNEDIDSSRAVFLEELYPRIKDMDIENAALEVNHWCHEKVNYKATDSRTMSPLGVIKTAYGRCGEESTFTVTAMRAVGIPARQVYTPRWAHTDDNHAWVEVYVNGKWKFLGACEPAPALNMGWFDAAVLRAMMVHTKVFGRYKGSERVIRQKKFFSELNLLSNYVAVKDVCVQVQDTVNKLVTDAYVEFGLYNYSEFYPLKRGKTDSTGCISLSTGNGTLRIFGSKDKKYGLQVIQVETTDTVKLILNKNYKDVFAENVDYVPPVSQIPETKNIDEALNEKRLAEEDKMREEYISTFYTEEKGKDLAKKMNLDAKILSKIMPETRGNYPEIEKYLNETQKLANPKQLRLLEVINPKDLHDITSDILVHHLTNFETKKDYPTEITDKYVLNPRIELEQITPYRAFLKDKFQSIIADDITKTANSLKTWINENIKIDNERNYYWLVSSPQGVYELKHADRRSRDIFFVAVMRSLGFPARIEEANQKIQYWDNKWIDLRFEPTEENTNASQAFVSFTTKNKNELQYRVHFALAKFDGKRFRTIELGWDKKLSDFDAETIIEPGYYQLITGNRLQGGSVLAKHSYFYIAPDEHKEILLEMRDKSGFSEVVGKMNPQLLTDVKIEKTTILAWINPSSEPAKHFIAEYEVLKNEFNKSQIQMIVFAKDNADKETLKSTLGENAQVGLDTDFQTFNKIAKQCTTIEPNRLPAFMIVKPNGDIIYLSQGYNIGIPEQILKCFKSN